MIQLLSRHFPIPGSLFHQLATVTAFTCQLVKCTTWQNSKSCLLKKILHIGYSSRGVLLNTPLSRVINDFLCIVLVILTLQIIALSSWNPQTTGAFLQSSRFGKYEAKVSDLLKQSSILYSKVVFSCRTPPTPPGDQDTTRLELLSNATQCEVYLKWQNTMGLFCQYIKLLMKFQITE